MSDSSNNNSSSFRQSSGDISRAEQIALDALHKVQQGDEALRKAEKKRDKLLILAGLLMVLMVGFFIWYATHAEQRQANIIKEFTTADRTFKYNDLGWKGQKDEYRKLMMKIFHVYGKSYNRRDVRALSPKEKPQYIDLCFDLAKDLGPPLTEWHGPIFAILESAINPQALGDFKTKTVMKKNKRGKIIGTEKTRVPTGFGLYQIRQSCGITYKNYYEMQPSWFKNKYPIRYIIDEDGLNWKTSTILMYCGMWGAYNKSYQGNHNFAISSHRFGPILERYFDDGNGKLPETFTYIVDGNKITFRVSDYWTDFLGMKEAFEAGKIELGEPFKIHWEGVRKQIAREEAEFSKNFKTFKYYKNEIEKLKQEKNDRDKRILELEKDIDETYKKFCKVYGEIHEGKHKGVQEVFKKARGLIQAWMKKYALRMERNIIIGWIVSGLIALLTIIIMLLSLRLFTIDLYKTIKSFIKKRRNKGGLTNG